MFQLQSGFFFQKNFCGEWHFKVGRNSCDGGTFEAKNDVAVMCSSIEKRLVFTLAKNYARLDFSEALNNLYEIFQHQQKKSIILPQPNVSIQYYEIKFNEVIFSNSFLKKHINELVLSE